MVHWSCAIELSSGHNRLSHLSIEGLKRALISWLLFSVLRFLYLLALIRTTSVMYGISKSPDELLTGFSEPACTLHCESVEFSVHDLSYFCKTCPNDILT